MPISSKPSEARDQDSSGPSSTTHPPPQHTPFSSLPMEKKFNVWVISPKPSIDERKELGITGHISIKIVDVDKVLHNYRISWLITRSLNVKNLLGYDVTQYLCKDQTP